MEDLKEPVTIDKLSVVMQSINDEIIRIKKNEKVMKKVILTKSDSNDIIEAVEQLKKVDESGIIKATKQLKKVDELLKKFK